MENENLEIDDSLQTSEEADPETVTEETQEESEETVESLKVQLEAERKAKEKSDELANNYKIRAEKAEKKAKEPVKEETSKLETKDVLALVNAKVAEEDIPEVEEFAKFKGVSVSEALKNPTLKAILNEKEEQRKASKASNAGPARRGSSQVSGETLLENAKQGKLPESDEEIQRLIQARKGK